MLHIFLFISGEFYMKKIVTSDEFDNESTMTAVCSTFINYSYKLTDKGHVDVTLFLRGKNHSIICHLKSQ